MSNSQKRFSSRTARLSARLTAEQHRAMKRLCSKGGITVTDKITSLVREWMEERLPSEEYQRIFPPEIDPHDV